MTRRHLTAVTASLTAALAAAGPAWAEQPSRTLLNDRAHQPVVPARLSAAQLNDRIHHGPVRPDDRAGFLGAAVANAASSSAVRPDTGGGLRGAGAGSAEATSQGPSGFDWSAAGIGALGAFGVCLLAVAGVAVIGHERRRHAAA
jgi:hypothetical protein